MSELSLFKATVVSNDDPDQTGKVQIRIEPELTDVPENDLPWAVPFISEASSSTVQKQVFVVGSVVWVLIDSLWQRFYYLGNKYFESHFSFSQVHASLAQLSADTTYKDLEFTLAKDGSISFHNVATGDCGYLHATGSYLLINKDAPYVSECLTAGENGTVTSCPWPAIAAHVDEVFSRLPAWSECRGHGGHFLR